MVVSKNVLKIVINASSHFYMCARCKIVINRFLDEYNGLSSFKNKGITIEMRYSAITSCKNNAKFDANDTLIHNYEIPNNDEEIGVVHKDINNLLNRENLDSRIKGGPYKKNILFFSGKDFWDREE